MKKIGIYETTINNSKFIFKLELLLQERKISKYLLEKDTGLDHKTIQNYCLGTLKKIDMRVVTILCEYLNCKLDDIILFKTNKTN